MNKILFLNQKQQKSLKKNLKIYMKMLLMGFSEYCKVNFHPAAIFQEDKAVQFSKFNI